MASSLTVLQLEDCLDALIDYRGKTPRKVASGVPLITAKVVKSGRIETIEEFIAEADYAGWMTRGHPEVGDVVLTTEAPLGEVARIKSLPVALAQRIVTLRGKRDLLDNGYLLYLLQSKEMQDKLVGRSSGTTVVGIKQSELRKIEVRLPPLSEQRAIAHVLGTLDDKMELNRRANETLTAMADALFKAWFVEFAPVRAKLEGRWQRGQSLPGLPAHLYDLVPDRFVESELGEIPEDWEIGTLGDVVSLRNERTQSSKETAMMPYVPIESIGAKSPFLSDWMDGENANSSLILFKRGDILFGAMRPYFHKVCVAPFDGVTRTTVFTLRPRKPEIQGYALMLAFQDETVTWATLHSEGSTIPYAKWSNSFEKMPVALPPEELQILFNEFLLPLIENANENIAATGVQAQIRNTLLPRLISGELKVSDAERMSDV